ncbi:hypothetical protein QSJ19_03050 [Gordonia sp. ABSL11-1]|uniref:hypothetical protein n=1 Tax=Gordonia sp. ABSL11-1 TaxID=3053924 RepID=UPI002572A585|nr:hypothetical protein [Gordonia sp. ABSL11-1]MDL9944577.1 hypothetical protein [Gordonia sp. ABSL11-1]
MQKHVERRGDYGDLDQNALRRYDTALQWQPGAAERVLLAGFMPQPAGPRDDQETLASPAIAEIPFEEWLDSMICGLIALDSALSAGTPDRREFDIDVARLHLEKVRDDLRKTVQVIHDARPLITEHSHEQLVTSLLERNRHRGMRPPSAVMKAAHRYLALPPPPKLSDLYGYDQAVDHVLYRRFLVSDHTPAELFTPDRVGRYMDRLRRSPKP